MLNILQLLSQDSFIVYNKHIAKHIGIEEAILLGYLIYKHNYFFDRNELDQEGYFFNIAEDRERETSLTRRKQDRAIKELEKQDFIETKLQGNPAKKHFKICTNKIVQIVQTRLNETGKQDCAKRTTTKKTLLKNNTKNNIYIFDFWNSKEVITHRTLTFEIKQLLEKHLKQFSKEEICRSISNYSKIFKSEETYFDHKWTLEEFLKRSNAFPVFLHKTIEDYVRWDNNNIPKNAHIETQKPIPKYKEITINDL